MADERANRIGQEPCERASFEGCIVLPRSSFVEWDLTMSSPRHFAILMLFVVFPAGLAKAEDRKRPRTPRDANMLKLERQQALQKEVEQEIELRQRAFLRQQQDLRALQQQQTQELQKDLQRQMQPQQVMPPVWQPLFSPQATGFGNTRDGSNGFPRNGAFVYEGPAPKFGSMPWKGAYCYQGSSPGFGSFPKNGAYSYQGKK